MVQKKHLTLIHNKEADSQAFTPVMAVLDEVLAKVMWLENGSHVAHLKMKLSIPKADGSPRDLEDLSYPDLIGAYTCLQIKYELYHEHAEDFSAAELAGKIKAIVFEEVRQKLGLSQKSRVA